MDPPQTASPTSPQPRASQDTQPSRVLALLTALQHAFFPRAPETIQPSEEHQDSKTPPQSLPETQKHQENETVFYLAYGSNLSKETFQGVRRIKPLSATNVCVPSLRLTFDLPALPYSEPCFANTGKRDPNTEPDPLHFTPSEPSDDASEKATLLSTAAPRYHKDAWRKPLVGVVYELTRADFARVIATEGGGSSYKDIIVPCYPLATPSTTVPWQPDTAPVHAHTLFAPGGPPGDDPDPDAPVGTRFHRPDPSYAQPSARYLKLLGDGAREHGLPHEYRDYLASIRAYRVLTWGQRAGKALFSAVWMPVIMAIITFTRLFADEQGRSPKWAARITDGLFVVLWTSYDNVFKRIFGDGERTTGE